MEPLDALIPAALRDHREALAALARPCLALEPEPVRRRRSGFGGAPLGVPGSAWPRGPFGPLDFVGQLDFAELGPVLGEALPALPRDGVLALFLDAAAIAAGSLAFELRYADRSRTAAPMEPPPGLLFQPFAAQRAELRQALPSPLDALADPVQLCGVAAAELPSFLESYEHLRQRLSDGPYSEHQVGGYPDWRRPGGWDAAGAAEGWGLLWQVHAFSEGVRHLRRCGEPSPLWAALGDVDLYLLARGADVAARRFDRARLVVQRWQAQRRSPAGAFTAATT